MCLQPASIPPIPAVTVRIAKAIFPKGSLYLTIGEQIGFRFSDVDFSDLYAIDGTPAISPGLLAMVTIFQFMQNLPDRDAADAVRTRIDWKYALHLALDDPGFDFSLLSDFRQRLLEHEGAQLMFERILERLKELDLLGKGGRQRTDSTHVLSQVRALSRLELVAESMRLALEAVADQEPDWPVEMALPHWYERYQRLLTSFRQPRSKEKREALALDIGRDGFYLLERLHQVGFAQSGSVSIQWGDPPAPSPPPPPPGPVYHHHGGPPPHAPAHGYRAKHQYRYYPYQNVYYEPARGAYFICQGTAGPLEHHFRLVSRLQAWEPT